MGIILMFNTRKPKLIVSAVGSDSKQRRLIKANLKELGYDSVVLGINVTVHEI